MAPTRGGADSTSATCLAPGPPGVLSARLDRLHARFDVAGLVEHQHARGVPEARRHVATHVFAHPRLDSHTLVEHLPHPARSAVPGLLREPPPVARRYIRKQTLDVEDGRGPRLLPEPVPDQRIKPIKLPVPTRPKTPRRPRTRHPRQCPESLGDASAMNLTRQDHPKAVL